MLDSKYINIRDAVEATDYDNDGALFHQTVDRLASILGFTKKREWYEAKAVAPNYFPDQVFTFKDFEILDACIKGGMLFKYFEHNNHYEKDGDSFTASTLHEDHMSLVTKKFTDCTVTSQSTLGLKYNVLSHREFRIMYPHKDSRTDVMIALDKKCLIRAEDRYLINPRYLLRLAEQKGVFI